MFRDVIRTLWISLEGNFVAASRASHVEAINFDSDIGLAADSFLSSVELLATIDVFAAR